MATEEEGTHEQEQQPPGDEMTLEQAKERLGNSRTRLTELIQAGAIPSRIELTPQGRAKRFLRTEDVEAFLQRRREEAARQSGKGRPIKLPKQPD